MAYYSIEAFDSVQEFARTEACVTKVKTKRAGLFPGHKAFMLSNK